MGGEIAQAIAAADIPVVLKDVDQKFVDVGLEKAREVTAGPGRRAWSRRRRSPRSRPTRRSRRSSAASPARRPTTASATSTSSSRPSPSGWRSSRRSSPSSTTVTPGHAILASNTSSLSITEIGDATSRPEKVVGFHFFYPASVMPLLEIVEGDETDAGDASPPRSTSPRRSASSRSPAPRCPGFVVNRILTSALSEVWRAQEERRAVDPEDRRGHPGAPRTSRRWGRSSSSTCSASTPCCTSPSTSPSPTGDRFYVHQGMQRSSPTSKLGAKTGGAGFYEDGEPQIDGRRRARRTSCADLHGAQGACVEACLRARGGRRARRARSTSA